MITIIADIGINHNGDLNIVKKLIDICYASGIDIVKFQKRNPDKCVPEHQKKEKKSTPWGELTYIDYKYKVEFSEDQYNEIYEYCQTKGVDWFASVWDIDSAEFMASYTGTVKIPSALITNYDLLQYCRENFGFVIMSTGMSTEEEIEKAVEVGNPDVIMHCNSSYPASPNELNLNYIKWLQDKYPDKEIGYSGHEFGLVTTFATVGLGVTYIERHITLDRMLWGSDQLSSIEPEGIFKLVRGIRNIEHSLGVSKPREVYESELSKRKSLRGN